MLKFHPFAVEKSQVVLENILIKSWVSGAITGVWGLEAVKMMRIVEIRMDIFCGVVFELYTLWREGEGGSEKKGEAFAFFRTAERLLVSARMFRGVMKKACC